MRAGRVEEVGAIARQIGNDTKRRSKCHLEQIDSKPDTKEQWSTVRQLTGREHEPAIDPRITADSLNRHYANVSTDASYEQPPQRHTGSTAPELDILRDGLRSRQWGRQYRRLFLNSWIV